MGIYKPEIGDTVEFWNDTDELWETGDVIAYGADHRIYFIQPNDEDLAECLVDYTNIRPVSEQETTGRMATLEFERDYWKNRAERAEAHVLHWQDLYRRMASDRDEWRTCADNFEFKWRMTAEGQAATRVGSLEETIDEMKELAKHDSKYGAPKPPKAVIDGMDDRWELNHDTGEYEFSDLSEHLDYIERRWGIGERIY